MYRKFCLVYAFGQRWFDLFRNRKQEVLKEGIVIVAFALDKLFHSISSFLFYFYDHLKNFASKKSFSLTLTKIKGHCKNSDSPKDYHYFDSKIF